MFFTNKPEVNTIEDYYSSKIQELELKIKEKDLVQPKIYQQLIKALLMVIYLNYMMEEFNVMDIMQNHVFNYQILVMERLSQNN